MRVVVVTGMSGAGKSTVLKFLEDINYFCVDNLPPSLIPKFIEVCRIAGQEFDKVALGVDIRGGFLFNDLIGSLSEISAVEIDETILFLDASNEVLVKRFKETRRSHPLAKNDRVLVGIEKERKLLSEVKKRATYILDTSFVSTRQLKEKISEIFVQNKKFDSLMITVLSFGFKYGIPEDSDLVFDVRFLPNPFYVPELKEFTGLDQNVRDFVLGNEVSKMFLNKLSDMVDFLIPNFVSEGKNQLVISVGCTGGKHRSVTLANELYAYLKGKDNSVVIEHRDILKDKLR